MKPIMQKLGLLIAMLCTTLTASAYDFTVDGIYYNITDAAKKTVAVTYEIRNKKSYSGSIVIPSEVQHNDTIYSVTSIGMSAFDLCTELTSVTIPNSVTLIDLSAFNLCRSLTSVTIPESVASIGSYAFMDCLGLTSVTIPASVTSIGESAFYGCKSITSVTSPAINPPSIEPKTFGGLPETTTLFIPKTAAYSYLLSNWNRLKQIKFTDSDAIIEKYSDGILNYHLLPAENESGKNVAVVATGDYSQLTAVDIPEGIRGYDVTAIGGAVFYNCKNLKQINFGSSSNVSAIGEAAFCLAGINEIALPQATTSIGRKAFSECSLLSIAIPDSVTSIGRYAFYACESLTSATIPTSVTSIGDDVFRRCIKLTSVTIPNSVTSIGNNAFYKCSALTSITIPNSVTSIGGGAFSMCSALTSITIPNSVTSLGMSAFYGCSGLTDVTVPNSVTSIGQYAFYNCSNLSSVAVSNSVNSIADNAFAKCNLSTIVLPPSVDTIGSSAFAGNTNLSVVAMGHKVTSIGEKAFEQAPINNVLITAQVPPTAPESAFSESTDKLFVQGASTVATYKNAPNCWNRFNGFAMSEPTGLTLEGPKKVEGVAGEQFTLKATLAPADVDLPYLFWRSTDPTKAYVDHNGVVTILEDVCKADDWKIIAETLYANGPTAEFAINAAMNGVEAVEAEEAATLEGLVDVYNLQGAALLRNASPEEVKALKAGIYIVRSGNHTAKVAVK